MAKNNSALEQLKSFLNELFQFDSQDLDFGVYKILHYKRKEIKDFIDKLLVDKVKEQLQTLTSKESKNATEQLKELEQDEFIQGWINANEEERKAAEKFGKQKIAEYKRIKTQVTEAKVSGETENHIYNHLTLFLARYYDKGDFISKRRFGKNEKYMVPYNGEETHFYWANHDQYYIKSSETFQQYAFKITTPQDNMVVNFKLTSAQLEQGNVKADEPNFFILSEKESEIGEKETNFFFEYRPLTDDEKKTFKGNNKQDVLDERAFEALKNKYGNEANLVKLWESDKDDKALLLKKINHYTRKNKYDFFIHKNLKGFLQRELDYYIKSELINVDDLYVTEVDSYFDRLKHNVKTIKVFKNIADTIIEFVSQIEDFQKKLWEKKKFVLNTEWVITIDRLVEYIGEETAKAILEEVIKNEKQVAEWKELFGEETVPKKLSIDTLKADLHSWRKFPIDTVHFSKDFKLELLNKLSEKIELEEMADGIVINSDNFDALNSLSNKYYQKIHGIYIDPPYNTGSDEFIYKDGFKHSTWNSAIYDRIELAKDLIQNNRVFFISIDDKELHNLIQTCKVNLGSESILTPLVWKKTDSPNEKDSAISTYHEYIVCACPSGKSNALIYGYVKPEILDAYPKQTEDGRKYRLRQLRKNGKAARRKDRPKLFYPLTAPDGTEVYPIAPEGWEGRWVKQLKTVQDLDEKNEITWTKRDYGWVPYYIEWAPEIPMAPFPSLVDDVSQNRQGKAEYTSIFPDVPFDTPKPTSLIKRVLDIISFENKDSIFLDFYAGSGTTAHSTFIKNNEDNGKRKFILSEMAFYCNTLIIPRIKKIAYSFKWREGIPENDSMNGLGVFFKYQRLEQYEEALENIAFTVNKDAQQQALEFDQYIPKYMLEFETKNSQTLVNTQAMKDPWDYKLKVWDGFTYDTEQAVDLVETFNYLIGLHMQKCITKELNGRKYQFVYGHNNANKNILAVWRSVKDWKLEDYTKDRKVLSKELENFSFDVLYVNEQAHLPEKYTYQPIEEVFKNKMLS